MERERLERRRVRADNTVNNLRREFEREISFENSPKDPREDHQKQFRNPQNQTSLSSPKPFSPTVESDGSEDEKSKIVGNRIIPSTSMVRPDQHEHHDRELSTVRRQSPHPHPRRHSFRDQAKMDCFIGNGSQNARRWLQRFERERGADEDGSPKQSFDWLEEFNILMDGEAADWADSDPFVKVILSDEGMETATASQVDTVKKSFLERFRKPEEARRNPIPEIQAMKQEQNESLHKYYQRALSLLKSAGSHDKTESMDPAKSSVLDLAIDCYVSGIRDPTLRIKMIKYPAKPTRYLLGAFNKAEVEAKLMKAEKEVIDSMKSEAERTLLRKMKEHILGQQSVPHNLVSQLQELTREEALPIYFLESQLQLESSSSTGLNRELVEYTSQPPMSAPPAAGPLPQRGLSDSPSVNAPSQQIVPYQQRQQLSQPRQFQNQPQGQQPRYQAPHTQQQQTQQPPSQDARNAWRGSGAAGPSGQASFDPKTSSNPYVRGDQVHHASFQNPLCVRCGAPGHKSDAPCTNVPLSQPEQSVLRELVARDINQRRAQREEARARVLGNTNHVNEDGPVPYTVHPGGVQERISECNLLDDQTSTSQYIPNPDPNLRWPEVPRDADVDAYDADYDADVDATKRTHEEAMEDDSHRDEEQRSSKRMNTATKGRAAPRKKKPLPQINALLGKPPLEIIKMAEAIEVVLPISHLAQISPHFRNELKRLFTIPRKKKEPKGKRGEEPLNPQALESRIPPSSQPTVPTLERFNPVTNSTRPQAVPTSRKLPPGSTLQGQIDSRRPTPAVAVNSVETIPLLKDILKEINAWKKRDRSSRAFGLPAIIWKDGEEKQITIPRDEVLGDQGSDINLIYPGIREFLGLELRPLAEIGLPSFRMRLPNGSVHEMEHWVYFHLEVAGVKRAVWAFACPTAGKDLSLLLGLPWLDSVDARFSIRDRIVEIGDTDKGEDTVTLQAPKVVKSMKPKIEVPKVTVEDATDSEESDDEDSSEEDATEEDFQ